MRSITLATLSLISLPIALAMAPLPAPAQDGPILLSPEAIGEIFCLSRVGNDMAPVEAILTEELRTAIREAEERNAAIEAANPGEKPPLGDGIPWQSVPDYAPVCAVGPVAVKGKTARVGLRYTFPEEPAANFADVLVLGAVEEPTIMAARWRIDDVESGNGGNLRATLQDLFAPEE